MSKLLYGDSAARIVSSRIAHPVADLPTLRSVPTNRCANGQVCNVLNDLSDWVFNSTSTLTDDGILVVRPSDGGVGAWLRDPGAVELKLPFTFATVDAALLLTLQAGQLLRVAEIYWQITADMTGGAASAIGVSSSNKNDSADFTQKGDLLGGVAGDVAAALTAALGGIYARGTIGTDWDTVAKRRTLFKTSETIRFDRITSAFTAGSGNVCVVGELLRNPGQ